MLGSHEAPQDRAAPDDGAGRTLLRLHPEDTVAVAMVALSAGTTVDDPEGEPLVLRDDVPAGHKVALVDVPPSASVTKFGVAIGTTTARILRGEHVHVHNLESERMRGDRD